MSRAKRQPDRAGTSHTTKMTRNLEGKGTYRAERNTAQENGEITEATKETHQGKQNHDTQEKPRKDTRKPKSQPRYKGNNKSRRTKKSHESRTQAAGDRKKHEEGKQHTNTDKC